LNEVIRRDCPIAIGHTSIYTVIIIYVNKNESGLRLRREFYGWREMGYSLDFGVYRFDPLPGPGNRLAEFSH
jgi:hypothetical protein